MIVDLFSHKIHSSDDGWPDKLVELASLFLAFDGKVYDREEIELALKAISPRAAYAPRDPSKFRDEISAYPAYLGLYRLSPSPEGWRIFLTETAKTFLLKEEPDVGSFMRLQLALFQYPSGMGAAFVPHTNRVRIQANARDRTLLLISQGVHLSPLRLIVSGLIADSEIKSVPFYESALTYKEIFALANHSSVNRNALPDREAVRNVLIEYRKGNIVTPRKFESRFHILKHTDLFNLGRQELTFRKPVSEEDEADLLKKITAITQIDNQFLSFDTATSGRELEEIIAKGTWGNYFDAISTLRGDAISALSVDIISTPSVEPMLVPAEPAVPKTFPLTQRREYIASTVVPNRQKELADPETTRIKRQRRNLAHKLLIDKMCEHLSKIGAVPQDNPHIDLYARVPDDGSFLFEMKSGGENLLDQIRNGISQLYEYKFRYSKVIEKNTTLCLVVPRDPKEIPWLHEYLSKDREICLCWFDDKDNLDYSSLCKEKMEAITAN
jgi:hypothetical protein